MIPNRRTGPWWFMQQICKILDRQPPDSDGKYFFYNGRLINQESILPQLRNFYAYILLFRKFEKKKNEVWRIKYWLHHESRPGQRDGTWKRINELYKQLAAIKRRLIKLDNPYAQIKIEVNLEY